RLRLFKEPWKGLGYQLDNVFGGLVLVLIASGSFAPYRGLAILNCLLVIVYIIALYFFRNCLVPKASHIRRLWIGFVLVSTLSSLVALWLWSPTPDMWLSDNFHAAIRNRFPLGHHNFSGGYFALTLPMAVAFTVAHQGWRRYFGIMASLSLAIALYSSGSRGAWLASSIAFLISLGIAFWQSQGQQRRKLSVLGFIFVCLIIMLFLSNPRIRSIFDLSQHGPTFDRILMVRAAGNILRHRTLVGVGPGNMTHVYNLYRPIESGAGLEMAQQLHNLPVHIAGELGFLGLLIYGWLLFFVFRLWCRLKRVVVDSKEQWLLNGIGVSSLSYLISSLTDYQLENIPISVALTCLLLLLILQADYVTSKDSLSVSQYISVPIRRFMSLVVTGILILQFSVWGTIAAAIYFSHSAIEKANNGQLIEAEAAFNKAARINPWDPTPNALMAQLMYDLSRVAPNLEDRHRLTQQTIRYYLNALVAAPNDAWFNNNLALLYLEAGDPARAETYATRTVALYPRNYNYIYYTLGLTYLAQSKVEAAIDALALELLMSPDFITMQIWNRPPFLALQPLVLEKAFSYYEYILEAMPPGHRYADRLYEQSLLIRWWAEGTLPESVQWSRLRQIVQNVIKAETQPNVVLMSINQQLEDNLNTEAFLGLMLLRAWLKPELYLEKYFESGDFSEEEMANVQSDILEKRVLKDWLAASIGEPIERKRESLSLAYRNASANGITSILRPEAIEYSILPSQVLQLFVAMPRDLPILDESMESIRSEHLNLVHSTRNGFKLAPLELSPIQWDRD
ncbi:MAG: tetratricopeptide repeat protein, partial [Leptolyngbya sp. SIO3F4]|nr:tetratricopeptide repeat protein [Leptolyngbya sp. SIO3F4]